MSATLRLKHICQFAGKCRLTATLQPRHQYYGGRTFQIQLRVLVAHQSRQLVVDYLHHQFVGLDSRKHVHSQGFVFYLVGECLCSLVVYVGVEQCFAYVFEGLGYIDFRYLALSFEYFERPFESFA